MNKPLKGKIYDDWSGGAEAISPDDVRSAVEWLKEQLKFYPKTLENDCRIIELIDKAFEDVTRKEDS